MKFKKLFAGLISLAAALFAVCAITVCAGAEWSGDYEYRILDDGTVEITDYIGTETELEIPSTLDGIKVTEIGYYAFKDYYDLTSVIIPNSVTSIGGSAFEYCVRLTSITLPESVTSIGSTAFRGCSHLSSIAIPDGVTFIGDNAFRECSSLISINIPAGVTNVGKDPDYLFFQCSSLTSINVDKNNQIYSSKNGVLFNKDMTEVIKCPEGKKGECIIPNGALIIDDCAFNKCSSLTSITLPDGVTNIGREAFENCSSLTSITVPDSVTSIGFDAFSNTPFLDNQTTTVKYAGKWAIDCDDNAKSATIKSGTVGIAIVAFADCLSLASIDIPDSVKSIGDWAFAYTDITSIKIPDSVASIGERAFYGCYSLASINIPSALTKIERYTFYGCDSLTSITIPGNVTSIGESAFDGCDRLTSIIISKGVTTIGAKAFHGCSGLTSITLPDSVTSIGENAFDFCESLSAITIPDSVTSIGADAFSATPFLDNQTDTVKYAGKWVIDCDYNATTAATIKSGTLGIADKAFYKCTSLESVTIPDSVKSIGEYAFSDCLCFTSVTIPKNVISIGDHAFEHCMGLTSIYLSDSVMSIGRGAFNACDNIADVYYSGSKEQWNEIVVTNTDNWNEDLLSATIHYDYGKVTAPSSVTGLKLKARSSSAVRLTWTKNTSADGYIIEQKNGNTWKQIADITTNATIEYRVPDLKAGTKYDFRVKAYKKDGNTKVYSEYSTVSAMTSPSAVTGLKVKSRTSDAVRLAWNKNTSADGYIIERKSGNTWVRVAKKTKNTVTECRIDGLKAGTAYTFRVKAYKMDGKKGIYGGTTTITAMTSPSAISGLKVKSRTSDAVRLTWTKNTSADGYIIERKSGNTWVRVAKKTKNTVTECRIDGLKAGTAYTFRVKAYKMSGKTGIYGGTTTITATTSPSAVSGLKLKASAKNAVRLTWTKNTSADGYIIEMKSGSSWKRVAKISKNSTVEFRKDSLKSKTSYTFRIKAYKMSGKTGLYSGYKTITVKTK